MVSQKMGGEGRLVCPANTRKKDYDFYYCYICLGGLPYLKSEFVSFLTLKYGKILDQLPLLVSLMCFLWRPYGLYF